MDTYRQGHAKPFKPKVKDSTSDCQLDGDIDH